MAKIITSGVTGLSVSGLLMYFLPSSLADDNDSKKVVYEEGNSKSLSPSLEAFENQERELLGKLSKLYSDFKKAIEGLESTKKKKNLELEDLFSKIEEEETKLQNLYTENKELLQDISSFSQSIFELNKQKLDLETRNNQITYVNDSLVKVSSALWNWGKSLENIVCAIDNKEGENCESKSSQWLSNSNPSSTSISGGGGQSAESQQALKKLAESKTTFLEKQKALKSMIQSFSVFSLMSLISKTEVEKAWKSVTNQIRGYRSSSELINNLAQKSLEESRKVTKTLNEKYEKLKRTYNWWEKLKKQLAIFYRYKGILHSTMCLNSQNTLKDICADSQTVR